jgi:hypothetical protein
MKQAASRPLLGLLFNPEDEDDMLSKNVNKLSKSR